MRMTTAEMIATTDEILVGMLTENTGRVLTDSGGAYGRAWERNQGMTVETAMAQPEAYWGYSAEWVTLDLFHYLRKRVEFLPELQAEFDAFAEGSDAPWAEDLESFMAERFPDAELTGGYTYNDENALSQDVAWWEFEDDDTGDRVAILQIHGGCDARWGFTAPKFFAVDYGFLYDCADFTVECAGDPPPQTETFDGFPDGETTYHMWDFRGGDCTDREGSSVDSPEFTMGDDGVVPCPCCGAPLSVFAPEPCY